MTVRFLLFSGNWANEGNFYLLETKESIIVLTAGKGFSSTEVQQEQQIGRDYLKANRNKVKALVVINASWQNIGLIGDICRDLGPQIPLYTSFQSRLILFKLFPHLRNRVNIVEKNREVKLGDFSGYFLPLSSYLIGNLALKINYSQSSFYFLEGFIFSSLLDNNLLFPPNFPEDFHQFLTQRKKNTYLITGLQGFHWRNNNSLFFAAKNFPSLDKPLFFILYDFDWLHIFELLEIARRWGRKVNILSDKFRNLVNRVLTKNSLNEAISKEKEARETGIYLLVGSPENINRNLKTCLATFPSEKIASFHFLVGTPPVIGGEVQAAKLIDYLYTQSKTITNLSKQEYVSLGVSFYDFKLLLQLLQPLQVITYQNSYKNEKFVLHLPGNFSQVENGCAWDFPVRKTFSVSPKTKKVIINLEELLVQQRESLGQAGLLIVLLITEWEGKKLQLKELRIEPLAISSSLNIPKLEEKIKGWWEIKITGGIEKNNPTKIVRKTIERRLNEKLKTYLSLEHDIELEESLILWFNHQKKKSENDNRSKIDKG